MTPNLKRLFEQAKGEPYVKRDGYTVVNMEAHIARVQLSCLFATHGEALVEELQSFVTLRRESRGVEGFHLNGDTAVWDEFEFVDEAEKLLAVLENEAGIA